MKGRPLAAPFALLGAAGGWLTADVFSIPTSGAGEGWYRLLLVVVTPVVAAFVGRSVAPQRRAAALRFPLVVVAGGAINGTIIGCFAFFPIGAIVGALWGLFIGAAFIPFLAPAVVASIHADARPRSLLAPLAARATWCAAFLGIAFGAFATGASRGGRGSWELALGAAAGAAVIAAMDAAALLRARTVAAHPRVPRTTRPAGATIDFGVGEETSEDAVAEGGYREAWAVARAYVGDVPGAMRSMRRHVVASTLMAAVSIACAAACFAR
jgi:hypothetical protein